MALCFDGKQNVSARVLHTGARPGCMQLQSGEHGLQICISVRSFSWMPTVYNTAMADYLMSGT